MDPSYVSRVYGPMKAEELEELQRLERMVALREALAAHARSALSLRVAELLDYYRAPASYEIDMQTGEIRARGGR